jgi:transposase
MSEVTTIGLDLAKNVFQVHGIDALGRVVVRRQVRRSQLLPFFERQAPCVVGIEACAISHHWARKIVKLGHEVRLMPARYVKPYVKRNKNDAADAEAICEAPVTGGPQFAKCPAWRQLQVDLIHYAISIPVAGLLGGPLKLHNVVAPHSDLGFRIQYGFVQIDTPEHLSILLHRFDGNWCCSPLVKRQVE